MKVLKLLTLALAVAIAPAVSHAQTYVATCTAHPEYCHQKISPLTDKEKSAINKAHAHYEELLKQLQDAGREQGAAVIAAVESHGMGAFPAVLHTDSPDGLVGGTCLGSIDVNPDGYLIYTPGSDIRSCEEEVHTAKKKASVSSSK